MKTLNIQLIFENDNVAKITIPLIKKQLSMLEGTKGVNVLYGEPSEKGSTFKKSHGDFFNGEE